MFIRQMPDALAWQDPNAFLNIKATYFDWIAEKFGGLVARVLREVPNGGELQSLLTQIDDDSLLRVLLSPEVSYRAIYPSIQELSEVHSFLICSLKVECARNNMAAYFPAPTWSA